MYSKESNEAHPLPPTRTCHQHPPSLSVFSLPDAWTATSADSWALQSVATLRYRSPCITQCYVVLHCPTLHGSSKKTCFTEILPNSQEICISLHQVVFSVALDVLHVHILWILHQSGASSSHPTGNVNVEDVSETNEAWPSNRRIRNQRIFQSFRFCRCFKKKCLKDVRMPCFGHASDFRGTATAGRAKAKMDISMPILEFVQWVTGSHKFIL